jgi:hypothetical protein
MAAGDRDDTRSSVPLGMLCVCLIDGMKVCTTRGDLRRSSAINQR